MQSILLNNPGVRLTKEQEEQINTKYEQYILFTVDGYGDDDSKIKLKFKKPSHAINMFNMHLKTGSIIGKHISRSNDKIVERL